MFVLIDVNLSSDRTSEGVATFGRAFFRSGFMIAGLAMVVACLAIACSDNDFFYGTELDPPQPAANFSLKDYGGELFHLADQGDKVVVLTFLYTSCKDVCPFIGTKLKQTVDKLGSDMTQVAIVVVSTDPERDSRARVQEYSNRLGMDGKWHYLIGDRKQLEGVWRDYYIAAPFIDKDENESVSEELLTEYGLFNGLNLERIDDAKGVLHDFGGGYDVKHSAPIWLIDQRGLIRVKLGMDVAPLELLHDVRMLLR